MNQKFDPKRFADYLAYDLKNARANYGLALMILGCFPVIFYILWILFNNLWNDHWTAPVLAVRISVFFLIFAVLCITFPSQQYGRLTERRAGADWLMLPASRLEKFLSMLFVCFVAVPLVFLVLYNLTDWILSLCDPTYGKALVSFRLNTVLAEDAGINIDGEPFIRFTGNGFWILWVVTIYNMLVYLLGALCFRKRKISGTILCLIGISILLSTVVSLLAVSGSFDGLVEYLDNLDEQMFHHINLKLNLLLWGPQLLWTGGLATGVWYRLKTLKH